MPGSTFSDRQVRLDHDDGIVMRFAGGAPSSAMTSMLRTHRLVHSPAISRLIEPYHYFWQTALDTEPIDTRLLSAHPEILDIRADTRGASFLTIEEPVLHVAASPGTPPRNLPLPGKTSAIIAVIDSGFDLEHPNLNYVDRSLHFNAIEFFDRQRGRAGLPVGTRRETPRYNAGRSIRAHGTSVAGAAAAVRRDPREPAIDGVAPGFPVMPLKIGAKPTSAQVAAAINWAADHGARVINMSFKVLGQPVVTTAIERAWRRGLVLCAASGNRRPGYPFMGVDFPARHPNVIAVGAIDRRGRRKQLDERTPGDWGSQFGNELDLVAPGMEVRTLDDLGDLGALPGNYSLISMGTSIASPQVAGLAALLFGISPTSINQEVRDAIEGNCHKLPGYQYRRMPHRKWRWNREVGYGSIRVDQSVSAITIRRDLREGNTGDDALYGLD